MPKALVNVEYLGRVEFKKFKSHFLLDCATFQAKFGKATSATPNLLPSVCSAGSTLSMRYMASRDSASARTMAPTKRERFYIRKLCTISFIFCEIFNFDSTMRLPVVDFIPTGPKKSVGLAKLHGRGGAKREDQVSVTIYFKVYF